MNLWSVYFSVKIVLWRLYCSSAELQVESGTASSVCPQRAGRWQWNVSKALQNQLWRWCYSRSVSSSALLSYIYHH